jgi:phosphate/sulfate permease
MLASLLSAAVWLMVATYMGLPVSTTHSIVGAVLGFGLVVFWGNWHLIRWSTVGTIVSSWVVSPLLSGTLSFFVFTIVQRLVLYKRDMVGAAKRVVPFLVFAVFEVICLVTFWKGLKHLKLNLSDGQAVLLATVVSAVLAVLSVFLVRRLNVPQPDGSTEGGAQNPIIGDELSQIKQNLRRVVGREFDRAKQRLSRISPVAHGPVETQLNELEAKLAQARDQMSDRLRELESEVDAIQSQVAGPEQETDRGWGTPEMRVTEKIFAYLQIISACAVAFAHGANDVANAVGPLSGVIHVLNSEELVSKAQLDQGWLLLILALGGVGIVVGLATWGWRVIETIGKKITELTPTRGFSAEFGAAVTILVASKMGLPISTTHTLVGAVLGVGFARGIGALNLRVIRDIVTSWLVTLPVGAGLAIVFFFILKAIFGG